MPHDGQGRVPLLHLPVPNADVKLLFAEEEEIPEMPVELYMLDKPKARLQLARKIDAVQHKVKKENYERR